MPELTPVSSPRVARVPRPPAARGPAAQPQLEYGPGTEVHLLDRIATLYRYRRIAAAVFILTSVAIMIQGYTGVPMYQAQARLLIEDERSTAIPGLTNSENMFYEDPEPYYQTQYKILKGRDLTRRVIKKLQLENVPEFNGTAPRPATPLKILADVKARVFGGAAPNAAAPAEAPKADETPDESALIGAFIGRVTVEPVRGSRLVDVSFHGEDPKFAARAVNTLVEEYVDQNLAYKRQTTENMLEWLSKELLTQQHKVEESERGLAEYRDKENALSLDDKQNIVLARLNQLNDAVTRAKTTRVQKEALYNQVKSVSAGMPPDALAMVAKNPQVQALKSKLADLQRERAQLLERYGDKHPQVEAVTANLQDVQHQLEAESSKALQQVKTNAPAVALDSIPIVAQNPQIQSLKSKLADLQRQKAQLAERYGDKHPQIQTVNATLQDVQRQIDVETTKAMQSVRHEYETALLEETTLARNLEGAKVDAVDLNRKSIGYGVMEREAKSNRQVYDALLAREKELRVASNSRANNVRVVDRAEVPGSPMAPSGRRTWLLSIVVGFVLAVGVAFGLDYMNDTIKTPEDVARCLRLPLLGLVPSSRIDAQPVVGALKVPNEFGEAFRSLRTSIMSRYAGDGTKTMVVTSAQPLEGKTTTACNIALVLAYGGARVLLIDGDMRRPSLHRLLRLSNERGLAQILNGRARVRDVIQRTVEPNLLAVTAGEMPPNPSELLSSDRMKRLLSNLSNGPFYWIIIDTPPVLAVTDAVILAPVLTGVTFVVGAEMTRRRLAGRALDIIVSSRPRMTGIILNKVDYARNKYYYSRYHGHQYKNYYSEAAV